jgi:hypothetical protein
LDQSFVTLGVVAEILEAAIRVDLPNYQFGFVSLMNISDSLSKAISREAESESAAQTEHQVRNHSA